MDIINLKYRRLLMQMKTKFCIEQVKVKIAHFKILISFNYHYITKIESELKYIKKFEKVQAREAIIFRAMYKQQWLIGHNLCNYLDVLNKFVISNNSNSNNNVIIK